MKTDTDATKAELPQDHPIIRQLDEYETKLFHSKLREALEALEPALEPDESGENPHGDNLVGGKQRTKFQEGILIAEIIEELAKFRHNKSCATDFDEAFRSYVFENISPVEGSDE